MNVTIDLRAGPLHRHDITRIDIDKNIEALGRAQTRKQIAADWVLLQDTKSILEAIRNQLTE